MPVASEAGCVHGAPLKGEAGVRGLSLLARAGQAVQQQGHGQNAGREGGRQGSESPPPHPPRCLDQDRCRAGASTDRLEGEGDVACRAGSAPRAASPGSAGRCARGAAGARRSCRRAAGGSSSRIALIVSTAESPVERRAVPRASRRGRRRTRRCRSGGRRACPAPAPATCSPRAEHDRPGSVGVDCVASLGPSSPSSRVPRSFARPKSRIFTRPSSVTKMFSGFRSRWTIPFSWAAAEATRDLDGVLDGLRRRQRPPAEPLRAASRRRAAPKTM